MQLTEYSSIWYAYCTSCQVSNAVTYKRKAWLSGCQSLHFTWNALQQRKAPTLRHSLSSTEWFRRIRLHDLAWTPALGGTDRVTVGCACHFLLTGGSRISVRRGRQMENRNMKASWGSRGRCKPPSGVWGSAPENFENQTFFLPQIGHFWLLLSMNTSLAEVKLHHQNYHLRVVAGALILRVRHRLV